MTDAFIFPFISYGLCLCVQEKMLHRSPKSADGNLETIIRETELDSGAFRTAEGKQSLSKNDFEYLLTDVKWCRIFSLFFNTVDKQVGSREQLTYPASLTLSR